MNFLKDRDFSNRSLCFLTHAGILEPFRGELLSFKCMKRQVTREESGKLKFFEQEKKKKRNNYVYFGFQMRYRPKFVFSFCFRHQLIARTIKISN